jgi:hypothetical protein
MVMVALLAGGTLMGILGVLLALPVAATVVMLIEELRVELPGEQEQVVDTQVREADDRAEEEYERRTEGVGAEQAAAIAVEISRDRREEESRPPEAVGTTIESGNANGQEGRHKEQANVADYDDRRHRSNRGLGRDPHVVLPGWLRITEAQMVF